MLIDTHCHLNLLVDYTFEAPITDATLLKAQGIIDEAACVGVTTLINVGTSLIESHNSIALAKHYPHLFASVGIHPNDLKDDWHNNLNEIEQLLEKKKENKIVAIGECGLDAHYPDYNLAHQKDAFARHIELSIEYDLPLVIHTRDVKDETLRCLEPYKDTGIKGTIHCFSEDLSFAEKAISYGFVLGIGGTITYPKNSILREVVKTVGIEHIILETDTPFLPPQPFRGQKNHPRAIAFIAQYLAELLELPFDRVAQKTTENAVKIFGENIR